MIIAIDYDGTITSDMKMFAEIIRIIKLSNHNPIIVTMRHPHEEDNILNNFCQLENGGGLQVYYTGRKAKKEFMANLNIFPDIWIDDNPNWILEDSA